MLKKNSLSNSYKLRKKMRVIGKHFFLSVVPFVSYHMCNTNEPYFLFKNSLLTIFPCAFVCGWEGGGIRFTATGDCI